MFLVAALVACATPLFGQPLDVAERLSLNTFLTDVGATLLFFLFFFFFFLFL